MIRDLLENAVDATREGIVITDALQADQPIIFANKAFVRITGYATSEVLGRNCRFLQAGDRDQAGLYLVREALARGLSVSTRMRNYRKDGNLFWNDLSISPMRDGSGKITHFVGLVADTTVQQQIAEQRQVLQHQALHRQRIEALGTLASGIAHDINNTLVPINTMGNLLAQRLTPSGEEREMVEAILQAGGRIQDLVRQIVLFARRDTTLPVQVNLVSEVNQVLNLLSTTIPPNVRLTTRLLVAPTVLAARGSLHQVVLNLLTNALHATEGIPDTEIDVSLDIVPCPSDEPLLLEGDYAHLSIADNGPGMDPETRARAFDPFFTTKGPEQGSGMGLAIVHSIVTTAGGAVQLESLPGRGTTVHIYWPVFPR